MNFYEKYMKRLLDIIIFIIGLPFFLIVLIIVSPIIWLEDKGNIFYKADRLGKNGKVFKIIKFRTMKENAPDIRNNDGSTYNSDDDPRLTKIGKILRKISIDEFPQLINILKGEMSFIGPRPFLNEKFDSKTQKLVDERNKVRPGITGYSQAYYRNSISQNEKLKYDIFYVQHINFILDVKIFFKTIITVIKKENIYNK